MMRGVSKAAMSVRTKDDTIETIEWELKPNAWYRKIPFIRGVFNFVIQMSDGFKYITKSAEMSGMTDDDEEEELTKFEQWLTDKLGDKLTDIIMGLGMILGMGFAVLLFMFVPTWGYTAFSSLFDSDVSAYRSLFEGILKIILFVLYLWATSLMKDIRRTYEYHGAEHKTIFAYESGEELTIENVKKQKRFHPRCGTSFVFLVLAISILFYSLVPINSEVLASVFQLGSFAADALRVLLKILLIPVLVGITYEIIRLAGRYDNVFTRVISAPGLLLQRLTTREPDDKQIEVALAALAPVIPTTKGTDKW
ncbi:MAG: DUF1385 domain-containing protein [Oscillospiraceae bacterium]|jgi:uncharacterized protein YqhQ|nr:DUF1385 domain-containing protein [Oscillospiraceae bacterium]